MNILLQQFLTNERLRAEARSWLHDYPYIDVKFFINVQSPFFMEAYDDAEIGPSALMTGILPSFDTKTIESGWAEAERSEYPPVETWFQLVELRDGLSLLVPEEKDPTERILLFKLTDDRFSVMAFDIAGERISALHVRRRFCLPMTTGSTCVGRCPNGRSCRLRVYVADGPARAFCEC